MQLDIHTFTFNPFQENTYLIFNKNSHCWIIDPGMMMPEEENLIKSFISEKGLKVQGILNTHCHIDHILGVDFIVNTYQVPFIIHEQEIPILNNAPNTAKMFGFNYHGVQSAYQLFDSSMKLDLDGQTIRLLLVPGHSPGSVALYNEADQWVISGDALFEQSIGRTDLMMGDHDTLITSIKTQLFSLPDDTKVYPGHGNSTHIGREKSTNPFLQ